MKFTPEHGRIELRSTNTDGRVRVEISDTGIGFEPELLPRIFNTFEQGMQERHFGGLGLGLSIAKAMVELHHGTIAAFSEGKGKGATFTVELATIVPVLSEPPPSTPPAAPREEVPRKILLVDDHVATLNTMARLLRRWGHAVSTATCVRGALDLASQERFDLLITDVGFPDGSGLDIMRQAGKSFRLGGIIISGYGTEDDIRESREAGFGGHLTKPINFDALRQSIQRMVPIGAQDVHR